jgi:hypothetical protein
MQISKDELKEIFEQKLSETTQVILEAVDERINASEKRITVAFEVFTDEVRGLLNDVNTTNIDATKLTEKVETTETVLKTNVLPRLEVLEEKLVN